MSQTINTLPYGPHYRFYSTCDSETPHDTAHDENLNTQQAPTPTNLAARFNSKKDLASFFTPKGINDYTLEQAMGLSEVDPNSFSFFAVAPTLPKNTQPLEMSTEYQLVIDNPAFLEGTNPCTDKLQRLGKCQFATGDLTNLQIACKTAFDEGTSIYNAAPLYKRAPVNCEFKLGGIHTQSRNVTVQSVSIDVNSPRITDEKFLQSLPAVSGEVSNDKLTLSNFTAEGLMQLARSVHGSVFKFFSELKVASMDTIKKLTSPLVEDSEFDPATTKEVPKDNIEASVLTTHTTCTSEFRQVDNSEIAACATSISLLDYVQNLSFINVNNALISLTSSVGTIQDWTQIFKQQLESQDQINAPGDSSIFKQLSDAFKSVFGSTEFASGYSAQSNTRIFNLIPPASQSIAEEVTNTIGEMAQTVNPDNYSIVQTANLLATATGLLTVAGSVYSAGKLILQKEDKKKKIPQTSLPRKVIGLMGLGLLGSLGASLAKHSAPSLGF